MAGNVVSNVKKYYGGQVPVPGHGDSDGKVKVLVKKAATMEIGGVQTEVELLFDSDDLTTPVTPQQLGQWTDENYLIAFKYRNDEGVVCGFILYALETDSTSTDTLVNRATFVNFKEDMNDPGASAYVFEMVEDSSTLARYLRDENGELTVKFNQATVEAGAQSGTLHELIDTDNSALYFEVVHEDGKSYLRLNTEGLDEILYNMNAGLEYIIGALDELPSDEHGYFNSSLYTTPGDGTTTNLVMDDFRISQGRDVHGDSIEFVPTHQEGGVDFGEVYLNPGTYIFTVHYTLQWVGNPRGTFLPLVTNVGDRPFDFSYEHEDVVRTTRIVTRTTRGKFSLGFPIDADTPQMGIWVKNLEIAQIASYNHPAVVHDTTLTGKGQLGDPLGVTPAAFGKVKDIPTSISQFRTGDVIPVDGPNGPAKMPKNDLLNETAQNAIEKSDINRNVASIGNIIYNIEKNFSSFNYNLFEHGAYYTSSTVSSEYYVRSISTISVDRNLVVSAKTGFVIKRLNAAKTLDTGWVSEIELEANVPYYICIARSSVDTTEVANIAEFVSSVTFKSKQAENIENLSSIVASVETTVKKEIIKPNDSYYVNGRLVKCYNPYKDIKSLKLCGQLHCHSRDNATGLYYDGTNNPSTTLQAYKNLGFDFVMLTDYGSTTGGVSHANSQDIPSGITWLFDSQEVRINGAGELKGTHICTYNGTSAISSLSYRPVQEFIDEYKTEGRMMSLAHPFDPMTSKTFAELDEIKTRLRFVEVFNGLSAANDEVGTYPYDIPAGYGTDFAFSRLLDNGNAIWGVAVSDAHTISVNWRMQYGCVYVYANENSRDEILKSLCCGNFIASEYQGQQINQPVFSNGVYAIDTGLDTASVTFYKENSEVVKVEVGRNVSYTMTGNEKYVRAVVELADNRKVWTQPVINEVDVDCDSYNEFIK